jgi:hypothetical protein
MKTRVSKLKEKLALANREIAFLKKALHTENTFYRLATLSDGKKL